MCNTLVPLSQLVRGMIEDQKKKKNYRIYACPVLDSSLHRKNGQTLYWKMKRCCAWGCSGWWTLPEKICRSQSANQSAELNRRLTDLCLAICRFFQVMLSPQATSRTISFTISNSVWYWYNDTHRLLLFPCDSVNSWRPLEQCQKNYDLQGAERVHLHQQILQQQQHHHHHHHQQQQQQQQQP